MAEQKDPELTSSHEDTKITTIYRTNINERKKKKTWTFCQFRTGIYEEKVLIQNEKNSFSIMYQNTAYCLKLL